MKKLDLRMKEESGFELSNFWLEICRYSIASAIEASALHLEAVDFVTGGTKEARSHRNGPDIGGGGLTTQLVARLYRPEW
jgi:hypothetical protein